VGPRVSGLTNFFKVTEIKQLCCFFMERRKRGRQRKMWMEGVQAAMTIRKAEPDQWRNKGEWRLVSGRW